MKGLALAELFYNTHGVPMLKENFSDVEKHIAVGLVGSGSECFGYDDEISQDHDFEAGFCLFLPSEDIIDRKTAFALERAYARLPAEFMGYKKSRIDPVGGNRHGVIRMADFFEEKTGDANAELSWKDWFFIPEQSLAEATNGKIFRDDSGIFTALREKIAYFPEDVRRKKLAGYLLLMGQAGQYNYARCIARGETAAAQLAAAEFVQSTLHVIFLLNKKYLPYYKWSFRALRSLEILHELHGPLETLLSSDNSPCRVAEKKELIETVCRAIADALVLQGLDAVSGTTMEAHAYSVNNRIVNEEMRNKHILFGV